MGYLLPEVLVPFRVAVMGLLFLFFFVSMTFYVYSGRRRSQYKRIEQLPLEDGVQVYSEQPQSRTVYHGR